MTEWERILADKPNEAPFVIVMDADSSNEVWDDVKTKLDHEHGWHIVGIEYTWEGVTPTVPVMTTSALKSQRTLQLQRGLESELLLPAFDLGVILHHSISTNFTTSGMHVAESQPFRITCNEVTRCQDLRVLFRTNTDDVEISLATVQLTGRILYHIITAPDDGRTKLGIPIDEM